MGCRKISWGKFITVNIYIKSKKGFQINNLTVHIKGLEKEDKTKSKANEWKVWAEINITENRKTVKKLMRPKCVLQKDQQNCPTRLTKKKRRPGILKSEMSPSWCGSVDWAPTCGLKVAGLIPGQGSSLGCRPGSQLGCVRGYRCFSPSLSLSFPLSLKHK